MDQIEIIPENVFYSQTCIDAFKSSDLWYKDAKVTDQLDDLVEQAVEKPASEINREFKNGERLLDLGEDWFLILVKSRNQNSKRSKPWLAASLIQHVALPQADNLLNPSLISDECVEDYKQLVEEEISAENARQAICDVLKNSEVRLIAQGWARGADEVKTKDAVWLEGVVPSDITCGLPIEIAVAYDKNDDGWLATCLFAKTNDIDTKEVLSEFKKLGMEDVSERLFIKKTIKEGAKENEHKIRYNIASRGQFIERYSQYPLLDADFIIKTPSNIFYANLQPHWKSQRSGIVSIDAVLKGYNNGFYGAFRNLSQQDFLEQMVIEDQVLDMFEYLYDTDNKTSLEEQFKDFIANNLVVKIGPTPWMGTFPGRLYVPVSKDDAINIRVDREQGIVLKRWILSLASKIEAAALEEKIENFTAYENLDIWLSENTDYKDLNSLLVSKQYTLSSKKPNWHSLVDWAEAYLYTKDFSLPLFPEVADGTRKFTIKDPIQKP